MKINWVSSQEARTEIANYIRSRASGIASWETAMKDNREVAKRILKRAAHW